MPQFREKEHVPISAITGGSSGIGRALALGLARRGQRVGLLARREDRLERVADEVRQAGGEAAIAACDVSDREQVFQALARVTAELGPVDLLIANAGVGVRAPAHRFDVEAVERTYRVNLLGAVYAIAAVLPSMIERQRGHVVGISSLSSYVGLPGVSPYAASKAGLNRQLDGLRVELRRHGIHVTTICPGFIRTEMTAARRDPMPFMLDVDDAAARILRAIERRRRVYNFPWQTALLVRLMAALPAPLRDRLLQRSFGRG